MKKQINNMENTFINNDKLMLDEITLKSMCPNIKNISDTQTIYYNISLSQNNNIKGILGHELYVDVLDQYTKYIDSGISFSNTHYSYIINNFLKPILAFTTYKRLVTGLSFKLKEGGLRSQVDDNSDLASYQDRNYVIGELNNDIAGFIKDLKLYIYDNRVYFPLYNQGFEHINEHSDVMYGIGKVESNKKNYYSYGNNRNKYR